MNIKLRQFTKEIHGAYMYYFEEEIISIPFATKYSAESCLEELSMDHDELFFKLRQVNDGWDILVSHLCKHDHLEDVPRGKEGERYGPKCKDCGEFVKC